MTEDRKRALKQSIRSAERQRFLDEMPIQKEDAFDLFAYLDSRLGQEGCNHDLRLVRAWLSEREIDEKASIEWLVYQGGGCDCEVLCNVEEKFLDAQKEAR